jgi:hypothetical protein
MLSFANEDSMCIKSAYTDTASADIYTKEYLFQRHFFIQNELIANDSPDNLV